MHPAERCLDDELLTGVTILVTGASDGIGRETALALGRRGANVVVHGRDRAKVQAVRSALEETNGTGVGPYLGDFTSLAAVRELADAVTTDHEIDVLVANAGATFRAGERTETGVERTFQVNHLAPWVLTSRLLPDLRASDGVHGENAGRIVVVASEAHRGGELDLDRARRTRDYDALRAYRRSKLANLLFAFELADRVESAAATGAPTVGVNACHPGFVPDSALWRDVSLPVRAVIGLARRLPRPLRPDAINSEAEGAAPSVYLAAARDAWGLQGEYVADCSPIEPAAKVRDHDARARLWEWSAEVTDEEPPV